MLQRSVSEPTMSLYLHGKSMYLYVHTSHFSIVIYKVSHFLDLYIQGDQNSFKNKN